MKQLIKGYKLWKHTQAHTHTHTHIQRHTHTRTHTGLEDDILRIENRDIGIGFTECEIYFKRNRLRCLSAVSRVGWHLLVCSEFETHFAVQSVVNEYL